MRSEAAMCFFYKFQVFFGQRNHHEVPNHHCVLCAIIVSFVTIFTDQVTKDL